jgi:hypothetical protein
MITLSASLYPQGLLHLGFQLNMLLKLVVCILLRVLGQVQGFRLTNTGLNILFSNCYMFRSYDHLQAEIYTWILFSNRLKMVIRPKHVAVTE